MTSNGSESRGATAQRGVAGAVAAFFINSKLTPLVIVFSILVGLFAVYALPRRGRTSDRRSDDRRLRLDAGSFGAGSGRARNEADGEAAMGDRRR